MFISVISLYFLCKKQEGNIASGLEASFQFIVVRASLYALFSRKSRTPWHTTENSAKRSEPLNAGSPAPDRSSHPDWRARQHSCFVSQASVPCSSASSRESILHLSSPHSHLSGNSSTLLRGSSLAHLHSLHFAMKQMTQKSANHVCISCPWVGTCPFRANLGNVAANAGWKKILMSGCPLPDDHRESSPENGVEIGKENRQMEKKSIFFDIRDPWIASHCYMSQ